MRLTPKNPVFYQLFSSAADNIRQAAELLGALVAADQQQRPDLALRLKQFEQRGDDLTHEILNALNTSFITPFDREDIAFLAGRLDDVIDNLEEAGDLIVLYRLQEVPAGVHTQVTLLHQAAQVTADAMPRLRTLSKLSDYWITINEIENRADAEHRSLLAGLFVDHFDVERPAELVTAIKTKDVVERLESAADAFEQVANVVQSIAAKES